ncbi:MAG: ubiquinol-cytochrome c reductase iron-sulfur subunit, partial [Chloroflexota bacterium]
GPQDPQALPEPVFREMRNAPSGGISRRQLIRRSIGAATALWLLEVSAGTIGFLWPNLARGFGGVITLGDIETVSASPETQGVTLKGGAPAYIFAARAFVQLADPNLGFQDGESADGMGSTTNVWTFWQRCPHLGCKPNFCSSNFWFECPCHGSRFDRLGAKIKELGPAPRGLDRFSHVVKDGELTVDTSRVILGPLPIPLGQPGLIPARSPTGCI